MRNILIISHDIDLAGVNYRIKAAFDKFSTKYKIRQVVGAESYIKYPYDIMWMGNNQLVNDLYGAADLVHITEHPRTLFDFAPKIWNPRRMPTIIHQHGTTFRMNREYYWRLAAAEGWTQICSTIDLSSPNVEWVPNPVDIGLIRSTLLGSPSTGVHVAHAPTNRSEKHTELFLANMIRLAAEDKNVSYDVIEGQSWDATLTRKAHANLFYDQLNYGYGNNAIESMAMGIPTIGGFVNQQLYYKLPDAGFYQATVANLGDTLREFVETPSLRKHWGARGLDYVTRVHEESVVVKQLERIYDETIERFK